jgi:transposase
MTLTLHHTEDIARLTDLAARESNAKQRDRYRVVMLILSDQLEGDVIARMLGRSPRFVDEWSGRYRHGGVDALVPRKQPGRRPKLTLEQEQQLKQRLDAGPRAQDGVCSLRGKDIVRILEQEFGVVHTLGGIYDVLRRIGYSSLIPRPRHRKNDPQAMQQFTQQQAPLLPVP